VGRTQELLFLLARHYDEWNLGRWRVYLDSPMAIRTSEIYWDTPQIQDAGGMPRLPNLVLSADAEASQRINRIRSGAIVIAGSGMCEGGRIVHHLKHNVWRQECEVIIVGYQAAGTLGRQLVDGNVYVRIHGENIRVRARIHTVGGLSAHGDQDDLARWYSSLAPPPPVYLVHGEPAAAEGLAARLRKDGAPRAVVAERGMKVDLATLT
jgi:metallo-beta-lactamase family protein